MAFLKEEEKLTTNKNHYISQWMQKKYGFSIKEHNFVRPIIFKKDDNSWRFAKNNKWEIDNLFFQNRVYSNYLEKHFGNWEHKAAIVVNELLDKNPFVKNCGSKLKINPLDIILKLNFFNNRITPLIVNLKISEGDSVSLSNFYTGLIQRFIIKNTLSFNYEYYTSDILNKTIEQTSYLKSSFIDNYIQLYQDNVTNKKGKTLRDLADAWNDNSNLIPNTQQFLANNFYHNNYSLLFNQLPVFFLGDNSFSLVCEKELSLKPLILPMSHSCILVHKDILDIYSKNINRLVFRYCCDVFKNSDTIIFPTPEIMNYWFRN